jgi:hypothetical protein
MGEQEDMEVARILSLTDEEVLAEAEREFDASRSIDTIVRLHRMLIQKEAQNAQLVEDMERIAKLKISGPHVSAKDGMATALATVDRVRDIAKAAIAAAKAGGGR